MKKTIIIFCILFLAGLQRAEANNLRVTNVSIASASISNGTANVQFDISWDNSWRGGAADYDAAWVFIKYSTDAGTTWQHATLKTGGTNPTGFSVGTGTGLDIVVPAVDKKGAFLRRSSDAAGSVSTSSIQFVWDYVTDGLSASNTARVKVFAIEMVYIPTGAFYAGSGGTETSAFYAYPTTTNAYQISSEAAITVGTGTGNLYYPSTTYGGDQAGPIPAAFPKGYAAFYMMKYEISQGQYAGFLNTITSGQASTRYPGQNGNYRHTISGTYPNFSASKPDRACNYLSWADLTAYSDWAGLRPMTELEFEKAARGTLAAVANEYAWGNATAPTAAATISGTENGTETITTSGANCNYNATTFTGGDTGQGPLRCGIFATSSSTRATSGAGYYGVMDLSGNLWKRPVTVGNATGRLFTGLHGDGALTTGGDANVNLWPAVDAVGAGFRGGDWYGGATDARASDRSYAAYTDPVRVDFYGGRAVRTSP
ncbi:MAG: SUMF1/EgtB/PvdO family nonheme iron enzyme [Candidatus Omnitrophota bacterium]